MSGAIHEGHRQRLKERFLSEGLDSFQPHEVLEFLLFFGIQRRDTNALAHELISRYGSLSEVIDAPYEQLVQEKGMTANAAVLLKALPPISKVYLRDKQAPRQTLNSPKKLCAYFPDFFLGEMTEVIYLLTLDDALQPISCDRIAEGTVDAANCSVRLIAANALRHSASRVVLAHNHPRGFASPSNDDVLFTREICKSLRMLDIELVDHIIVAKEQSVSIREIYPSAFGS